MYKHTAPMCCIVIIALVCIFLFWWDCTAPRQPYFHYVAPSTLTAAECRSAINAYRKSKSIFPLEAATAEQQRCADESAKIDAKGYAENKKWYASGDKCKASYKHEFLTTGSTFEEKMKQYTTIKDGWSMYSPYASSVACGTDGNGFYLINYYISSNADKPPVLGKPLDKLGDKPYDLKGPMDAKSMIEFINYIRIAKKLKPLAEATASQMSCAQKISDACLKNYETKGEGALNPNLYQNCSAQGQFMTMVKPGSRGGGYPTMLNDDAKLKLVLNKDFKSVACGFTKMNYIFSVNFYT